MLCPVSSKTSMWLGLKNGSIAWRLLDRLLCETSLLCVATVLFYIRWEFNKNLQWRGKKRKKVKKKMLHTTYNLYCPNEFFLLILGRNMSRTWRRGLLLTSRNPVGFPDWVEALLTHSVCSAESLMMNCWAQKWEEPYLLGAKQLSSHWLRGVSIFPHSQTMWEWTEAECSEHWEDRQRGQEENSQHIHWKTASLK